ncbi:hypothetical protein CR205_06070 [Alteribacter lacisalsi]|uniref:ABC transporter permease n=1 Tax=Alteribacter lacisalsi TaxID=2045244 RepID=A0A2W0HDV1_9BACI|nr:ABC transporter permease subunit [Alteribacter lacisalsi]PYZ98160.1 hypothetical protein CR205_06070 [Alteribacter lacisalsi]
MKQFINLLRNECMKTSKRTGTRVMVVLLLSVVLAGGLITKYLVPHEESSGGWEQQLEEQTAGLQTALAEEEGTEAAARIEEQIALNEYYLQTGTEPLTSSDTWSFFIDNGMVVSLITMFTVIVAAGIVSQEHSSGTIKLLLARPVSRWKVLFSKWAAVIVFAFFMTGLFITATFLTGLALFPDGLAADRSVEMVNGEIRDWSAPLYGLTVYGLQFVEVVIYGTMAFMIGTVFRNQALSVGISLTALFMGTQIVFLLSSYEWAKYILFANTYLIQYLDGAPMIPAMTPAFSAVMLLLYAVIFLGATFTVFSKRDVAD